MKFYCDNCQTKYSIADEKVRGKVLKVRCKKCSHVITVREASAPAAASRPLRSAASAPPPVQRPPQRVEWHYAINGQSFGPLDKASLDEKFSTGELGDAVYVWNETFTEWKVVKEVEAFAGALARAAQISPPKRTLGISQPIESLDRAAVEGGDGGKVKAQDSQKDRLQALRDRLQLDESVADESPARGASQAAAPGAKVDEFAFAETLPDSGAEEPEDEPWQSFRVPESFKEPAEKQEPQPGIHDGLFSSHDAGLSSHDEPEGQEEQEEEEGEDAVPFFPSAPKLGDGKKSSSMSRVDEMTGSLLIQINAIKSDGRKRAIATVFGVLLALGAVGSVAYFGWTHRGSGDEEIDDRPRIRADHVGQEPQFHTYTAEERARLFDQVVIEQELVISREDSIAAYEREEQEARGESSTGSATATASAMPEIDPSAFRRVERDLDGSRAGDDGEDRESSRFQRPGMVGLGSDDGLGLPSALSGGDDGIDDDRFRAMAALQTDTQRGIYNPRDEFDEHELQQRERLSNQDIARGMQNVMESVGSCRQRHIMRGGTLEHDRVEVTLDIDNSGDVTNMELSPGSLVDTDFGRCMASQTRRWRFPPFSGDPMQVRTPFHLQD